LGSQLPETEDRNLNGDLKSARIKKEEGKGSDREKHFIFL